MSGIKNGLIVLSLLLGLGTTGASGCGAQGDESSRNRKTGNASAENTQTQPTQTPSRAPSPDKKDDTAAGREIKVLAQGAYGRIEEPFVVVARDAEVYAALRGLVEGLPEMGAEFFKSNAVVAAFLGTRNSGGFSVEITSGAGGSINVSEKTPPADAMTTQALTQPFKVVSVPLGDEESIRVDLPEKLKSDALSFQVTAGEFNTGGGIAGRSEKFSFNGTLGILRHEKLRTVFFDLKETGGKGRAMRSAATGIVKPDGQLAIASTSAGGFVQMPRSPLKATGSFNKGETRLTLEFQSLPPRVSDGFNGGGQLTASGRRN